MHIKAKHIFTLSILAISAFFIIAIVSSISPNMPSPGQKPIFYSNQMRQDLKATCVKALKNAKNHIHLVMFGLTDPKIIDILNKKSEDNLKMKVFFDKRSSNDLDIKENQKFKMKSRGLMHQKILIIDESLIFIGSANFTMSSLLMHDNLIIGFYSPEIAKFLIDKTPMHSGTFSARVGGQKIDIWLLPDFQNKALTRMLELIDKASSSIEIAMFTFTHPSLVEALIKAKNRGVKITLAIDFHSKNGVSRSAIEKLKKERIDIRSNQSLKLCHHKYILIDNQILVCGSANWTKAAFTKNYDCFLILYNLNHPQKKFMKKLGRTIQLESSLLK
ncbi:MAG: Phospholipase D [Candidatus Anoxychlamydiales bacterium]|nr:Phospholipase D [Candidatus Anoxychlamydiales bacterium]